MDILTYGALLNKVKDNKPTDAQVAQAVDDYLDDHPEATTTVQDGAITYAKLDSNLKATIEDIPSTAADVGAIASPSSPATGAFLVWSGSAWIAQTLSTWQGGNY